MIKAKITSVNFLSFFENYYFFLLHVFRNCVKYHAIRIQCNLNVPVTTKYKNSEKSISKMSLL